MKAGASWRRFGVSSWGLHNAFILIQRCMYMSKFGLYSKITTHPGQRDALVAVLLDAAALMQHVSGCELYVVNVSPTEPEVIWVTEAWSSAEAHQASLTLDGIKETIKRGRPLIAGGERIEIVPIGGKGLPTG
jgi:quinol monooxygenase YgiN